MSNTAGGADHRLPHPMGRKTVQGRRKCAPPAVARIVPTSEVELLAALEGGFDPLA